MSQDALSDNALSLSGINALYGDSHVLHDVSFALKKGRVLALLGRNGAGKTTCMNAIIGFLRPRDGDIRLHGEQIARLSPDAVRLETPAAIVGVRGTTVALKVVPE